LDFGAAALGAGRAIFDATANMRTQWIKATDTGLIPIFEAIVWIKDELAPGRRPERQLIISTFEEQREELP
jgi:hypothetical protein